MYIRNTLSGQLEKFQPNEPGVVKMYVCGPTVYGLIHVGNARPVVVFDAFRRFLEYRGYRVILVQNFTDIDDKIINRAKEWGVDFSDVANTFIAEYWRDITALGVRAPNFAPKTSDFIPDMIEAIKKLIEKGYAYVSDGDVYFDVQKFPRYGELSHRSIEEMLVGARVDPSEKKRNPVDFALWKAAKPGEPSWDSPWGKGRPGWHIECSVMSTKLLGSTLDIHAGGEDLIFPHHENEKAQSEALTGERFVKYWMHNGMIRMTGDKMSKSVGNVFLLRNAIKKFGADALKLFFLSKHYRSPIDFLEETLEANVKAARRVREAFEKFESKFPEVRIPKNDQWMNDTRAAFVEALENDFNTPAALALIFDLVNELNKAMDEGNEEKALKVYHLLRREFCPTLGLFELPSQPRSDDVTEALIKTVIDIRSELRANKMYQLADLIRQKLSEIKIELRDTPSGTTYTFKEG
ncbi:cysteine--tRNA ligase [Pseudothermotoga thermarum]|uniref:Cysteine--tRNA ligase n=1 Tax=Pseudothermotoga thermarum DSM 5069 TaxID=688269 RepID=F7YXP9_9THEM|nr:cysteine--tRNA ligase [Pseudothermotoga thermarum]AEH50693.1 cysteinyl-tRNA synthetase [Pseudothermotoga thermarum DSM 5069]